MLTYHYAALTQPSAEFPEPPPITTVNAPSLNIFPGISTAASCASDRAQSPSLTAPPSPIQASETPQAELVEIDSPLVLEDPALSLEKHATKICAEVMALGEQSLLVYQGMLSRLEHLLVSFSKLHGLKSSPQLISNEQGEPSSSSTEIPSVVAVSLTLMLCICMCTLADL